MFEHLIESATPENPLTLAALLFEYDRLQRYMLTPDELGGVVDSMFGRNLLVELAPGRYVKNPDPATSAPYTRVHEALYDAARGEAHEWHEQARRSNKNT